jgi:hypothetical protein
MIGYCQVQEPETEAAALTASYLLVSCQLLDVELYP